jgi:hypothetical protein
MRISRATRLLACKDPHVGIVYLKDLVGMYLKDADFACDALAGVWLSELALLERLDRHLLLRQQVCAQLRLV